MRIKKESEILDETTRAKIIEQIEASENKARKDEAYKRHMVWKDQTKDYVRDNLLRLLDAETVQEMEYCLSNVSIAKKIIDKLARVYSHGVERAFNDNDEATEALQCLSDKLKANSNLKTLNRILKLQRNATLYIKPVCSYDKNEEKVWRPSWVAMAPYLYDVIEQDNDRTVPLVYVLSNYERPSNILGAGQGLAEAAARHSVSSSIPRAGNGRDELIADNKEDEDLLPKKKYIWWSDSYHFTTMGTSLVDPDSGEPMIIQDLEKMENPIGEKPFVDMHIDQEGSYWATGGNDLIDAAVLINCMLTNAHHIGVTQGYGQLVVTGSNIPTTIRLGPNKMIGLPQESSEDPAPSAEFITANPPLAALQDQIEMYLALLLTTNNLSTNGISANLQGGITAPSGIALAIDKADSLEDVMDQREMFKQAESPAWVITAKWLQLFNQNNELQEDYEDCVIPETEPVVQFKDAQMIMSEAEKLDNIKRRQEMNLNTEIELIMKDRNVSREEAEVILKQILEEKIERQMSAVNNIFTPSENEEPAEEEEEEEDEDSQDDSQ